MERRAGILLPIFSLPSNYGIGTLGKQAFKFVDFLVKAEQSYWQVLPVGPTSYGDSPYQSFSSYAGNPYFIDLDLLIKDGLLSRKDVKNLKDSTYINYEYLYNTRFDILYKAYKNGFVKYQDEFINFRNKNLWLEDYALFMSIKKHFNNVSWLEWPDDIKCRENDSLNKYCQLLIDDINFYEFVQFLFDKQFNNLKEYANNKGIKLIGDMPIYVALDSCDVWANPDEFLLDKNTYFPKLVAGVPPDYFSKDGQLWGNPLYDWNHMKSNGYKWWIDRVSGICKFFDVIRIDHFRAFEQYWAIPYDSDTAKKGQWFDGPGIEFVNTIKNWFYDIEFIAEDLGIIDDRVRNLVKQSNLPGMRVMQFSIGDGNKNTHLPHNYIENCICYIGTHDNMPINGFMKHLNTKDRNYFVKYYSLEANKGYNNGFIRSGMQSIAKLFIAQIQDYLGLGEEATINKPGTINCWRWKLKNNCLNYNLAIKIARITKLYGRQRKD